MGSNFSRNSEHRKLKRIFSDDLKTRRKLIKTLNETISNLQRTSKQPDSPYKQKWQIFYEDNFLQKFTELEHITSKLRTTAIDLGPAWEFALQNRLNELNIIIPPDVLLMVQGLSFSPPLDANMPKPSNNFTNSSKKSTVKENSIKSNTK